jgi:transposase
MARRTRRSFTPQFKAEVVLELLTGRKSAAQLCREHQLSPNLVTLWKQTYLERLPVVFQSEQQHGPEQARVAELEQIIGRQTVELEILKKAHRLMSGPSGASGRLS